MQSQSGGYESYLALRTRLPVDQGLNTYYPNIHRDWSWGEEENQASLNQIRSVLHDHAELGDVLVLGAGAGRLAYDIHKQFDCSRLVAMDFNPLLILVAKQMARGKRLSMYEFPIAPRSLEDDAVLRKLSAPEPAGENFHLVLGDVLRPPFAAGSFDTVVTPWLIDIITEDLPVFAARVNRLLKDNGRWVNFGSLAFADPGRARRYSPEEAKAIVAEAGFSDLRGGDVDAAALAVAQVAVPGARLRCGSAFDLQEQSDVVVGNPPFVSPEHQDKALRAALRRRYAWLGHRFDLSVPFAEVAVEATRVGGGLALVLPAALLSQPYATPLRRRWLATPGRGISS